LSPPAPEKKIIQNIKPSDPYIKLEKKKKMIQVKAMISLEDIPENTLSSSVVKASCALVRARPASSQTLDERESAFSLPLFATCYFFGRGVISSI